MKIVFTDEQKQKEINKVYIEAEDVVVTGDYLEGEGKSYVLTGNALIEGEVYREFQVEFELLEDPDDETAESIMSVEWDWYDFLC